MIGGPNPGLVDLIQLGSGCLRGPLRGHFTGAVGGPVPWHAETLVGCPGMAFKSPYGAFARVAFGGPGASPYGAFAQAPSGP